MCACTLSRIGQLSFELSKHNPIHQLWKINKPAPHRAATARGRQTLIHFQYATNARSPTATQPLNHNDYVLLNLWMFRESSHSDWQLGGNRVPIRQQWMKSALLQGASLQLCKVRFSKKGDANRHFQCATNLGCHHTRDDCSGCDQCTHTSVGARVPLHEPFRSDRRTLKTSETKPIPWMKQGTLE